MTMTIKDGQMLNQLMAHTGYGYQDMHIKLHQDIIQVKQAQLMLNF